jgi:hypothetical protein
MSFCKLFFERVEVIVMKLKPKASVKIRSCARNRPTYCLLEAPDLCAKYSKDSNAGPGVGPIRPTWVLQRNLITFR